MMRIEGPAIRVRTFHKSGMPYQNRWQYRCHPENQEWRVSTIGSIGPHPSASMVPAVTIRAVEPTRQLRVTKRRCGVTVIRVPYRAPQPKRRPP